MQDKLNFVSFVVLVSNYLTFPIKECRGGVIRISPYWMYRYCVHITLPCIVRPSLPVVVFQTNCCNTKHVSCPVLQLQSCIGDVIQRFDMLRYL